MSEFDRYASSYKQEVKKSISFIPQQENFEVKSKLLRFKKIINSYTFPVKVLDYGCGVGTLTSGIKENQPRNEVTGIDTSQESILEAKRNFPECVFLHFEDELPLNDMSIDIVFCTNVFHHIKPSERIAKLEHISKKMKRDGIIVIVEHNPYNPLTQLAVKRCDFDADAVLMKKREVKKLLQNNGFKVESSEYMLFLPLQNETILKLENLVKQMPFGAQHITIGILR